MTQQYYANAVQGNGSIAGVEREYGFKIPDGMSAYKLTAEKTNVFDIIPFNVTNENHPLVVGGKIKADGSVQDDIFTYFEHRNINENGDSCICLNKTFGKKCPICEERERRIKALGGWSNPKTKEDKAIKALAPKARVAMNIVDWSDRAGGLKILTGSEYMLKQGILTGSSVNKDDEFDKNARFLETGSTFQLDNYDWKTKKTSTIDYINFLSPLTGYGIAIKCEQATWDGHSFAKPVNFNLVDRKQQYPKEIVDHAYDLSKCLNVLSYDEIEQLFFGATKKEETVVETPASVNIKHDEVPVYESKPLDMSNSPVDIPEQVEQPVSLETLGVVTPVTEVTESVKTTDSELSDLQKLMGV